MYVMNTIFSILFCIQVDNYKTVLEDKQKDLGADDPLPKIQTSYMLYFDSREQTLA